MILAIQTVEGASVIKHSQIGMTMLGSGGYSILGMPTPGATGANKTSNTVAGQGVIIIRKIALVRATSDYLAVYNSAESTKADIAFGDLTLVQAELAGNPVFRPGGILWETVGFSGTSVNLLDLRPNFIKVGPDTICAKAYHLRNS